MRCAFIVISFKMHINLQIFVVKCFATKVGESLSSLSSICFISLNENNQFESHDPSSSVLDCHHIRELKYSILDSAGNATAIPLAATHSVVVSSWNAIASGVAISSRRPAAASAELE